MKKVITYETLRNFAYSNDRLIMGKIRGIVVEFFWAWLHHRASQ